MAIVSSIIALAHALKLSVVAEGVETDEQARVLHLLSCNEAQGNLYSKPVSAGELAGLLGAARCGLGQRDRTTQYSIVSDSGRE